MRKLTALVLAASAAGCAVIPSSSVSDFADRTGANSFELFDARLDSSRALVLPVVHDRQTAGPSCGAHALASVVNYWHETQVTDGQDIYRQHPPADTGGYSLAELVSLARAQGLLASAVRMPGPAIVEELERGRPVLVPVRLPSVYVGARTLPGGGVPVVGLMRDAVVDRAGAVSELGGAGLIDHYLLVAGYEGETFVVVEPVRGFRTIGRERLERYRAPFGNAAIVFSAAPATG